MNAPAADYGRTLVRMQFGSHVYGTNLPTSDLDLKAIHVPPSRDIILGRARDAVNVRTNADNTARNGPEDVDFESFSLQKYMRLLLEGQTVALTMLFTPDRWIIEASPEWEVIRALKKHWLHSGVSAFAGYCRQQSAKYGIRGSRVAASRAAVDFLTGMIERHGQLAKLKEHWTEVETFAASAGEHVSIAHGVMSVDTPCRFLEVCNRKAQEHVTLKKALAISRRVFDEYGKRALMAETNEGVDWKALMHAVRVCGEATELLMSETITYPRPEADLLLKIRKGELAYKRVAEIIEEGMVNLERCHALSTLPAKPNVEMAETLVFDVYAGDLLEAEPYRPVPAR
ncbi:MAG: nucleotidyltransferase domain-containing protein [Acetobacteraceae bacterium]